MKIQKTEKYNSYKRVERKEKTPVVTNNVNRPFVDIMRNKIEGKGKFVDTKV